MPIYWLTEDEALFPPTEGADSRGVVAVGGTLTPTRLLEAYRRGIFPWYSEGEPILWHSPDPRFVLEPTALHVPKSLKKTLRHLPYELRYDTDFAGVMRACGEHARPGQNGTWITDAMLEGYTALHEAGYAHSAEAWQDGALVGGLYGVWLGRIFYGESMFAEAPDASKVAFVELVARLREAGCSWVDCQQETEHLARFGAASVPRRQFLKVLAQALAFPTQVGKWDRLAGPAPRDFSHPSSP